MSELTGGGTIAGMHLPHGKALYVVLGGGVLLGLVLLARSRASAPMAAAVQQAYVPAGDGGAAAAEFAQIQAQASSDIANLQAGAAIKRQELDYAFSLQKQDKQLAWEQVKQAGQAVKFGYELTSAQDAGNRSRQQQVDTYNYNLAQSQIAGQNSLNQYQYDPNYSRTVVPWAKWTAALRKQVQKEVRNGKLLLTSNAEGVVLTPTNIGKQGHQPLVTVDTNSDFFGGSQSIRGPAGSFDPAQSRAPQDGLSQFLNQALTAFAGAAPYIFGGGFGPAMGPGNRTPTYPGGGGGYYPQSPYYYA